LHGALPEASVTAIPRHSDRITPRRRRFVAFTPAQMLNNDGSQFKAKK